MEGRLFKPMNIVCLYLVNKLILGFVYIFRLRISKKMTLKNFMLLPTLDAFDNMDSQNGLTVPDIINYIQRTMITKLNVRNERSFEGLVLSALERGMELGLLCNHGHRFFRYKVRKMEMTTGSP